MHNINWYKIAQYPTPNEISGTSNKKWVDPTGTVYDAPHTHHEWIMKYEEFLNNEYGLNLILGDNDLEQMERDDADSEREKYRMPINQQLMSVGWVRLTTSRGGVLEIEINNIQNMPAMKVIEDYCYEYSNSKGSIRRLFINDAEVNWGEFMEVGTNLYDYVNRR